MRTAHTVIVGAGIMGLTLARELLARREQASRPGNPHPCRGILSLLICRQTG